MKQQKTIRVLNYFFIVIFVLSAILQYNDPDPYIWVPLYLYGAFLCFRATKKKFEPALYLLGLAVYIGYATWLFFDSEGVIYWAKERHAENIMQNMKASKPWIEQTREFGGLIMLIAALVINMVWLRKRKPKITRHV